MSIEIDRARREADLLLEEARREAAAVLARAEQEGRMEAGELRRLEMEKVQAEAERLRRSGEEEANRVREKGMSNLSRAIETLKSAVMGQ